MFGRALGIQYPCSCSKHLTAFGMGLYCLTYYNIKNMFGRALGIWYPCSFSKHVTAFWHGFVYCLSHKHEAHNIWLGYGIINLWKLSQKRSHIVESHSCQLICRAVVIHGGVAFCPPPLHVPVRSQKQVLWRKNSTSVCLQ